MKNGDTIAAVSTAPGKGGIGVIRLSGPTALSTALSLFRQKSGQPQKTFRPRYAHYGLIIDPDSGKTIDQAVVTYFAGHSSYTGEDVVEISTHGSKPILQSILEIITRQNVRIASPGEFTYRAVSNEKLDLTQAEAVNEIINADTMLQAESAMMKLSGNISSLVEETSDNLIDLIARLEVEVDFAEEGESTTPREQIGNALQSLKNRLQEITLWFHSARILKDGATVVLAGPTNAGKSTLFNSLLKSDRSIIDAKPGTTRDYISEKIELEGVVVNLIDTAGLRDSPGAVESHGIAKTEMLIEKADLVLLVHDAAVKDHMKLSDASAVIDIYNKADIATVAEANIGVSAKTGEGLEELREIIIEKLGIGSFSNDRLLITELRQQELFLSILSHLKFAEQHFSEGRYDELVLEELNLAIADLREITGKGSVQDILSTIFSSFCVGK
jgi:tRNA modification GTPase